MTCSHGAGVRGQKPVKGTAKPGRSQASWALGPWGLGGVSLVENETPACLIPCLLQDSGFISRSFHVLVSVEWWFMKRLLWPTGAVDRSLHQAMRLTACQHPGAPPLPITPISPHRGLQGKENMEATKSRGLQDTTKRGATSHAYRGRG